MALETGDVKKTDYPPVSPPPPISGDDTSSPEPTTSFKPGPEETDPTLPPGIDVSTADPDATVDPSPSIATMLSPSLPNVAGGSFGDAPPDNIIGGLYGQATPQQYQDLLRDDRQALQNKIMVEGAALREQDRLDRDYSRRMEQAFRAEMATANELRPWDAQREMASRKHD